jgi:pilus assembly protein Flp/PilA
MRKFVSRFAKNDSGVTALEYGIMAGLIAGTIILTVTAIGVDINGVFTQIDTALQGVPGA